MFEIAMKIAKVHVSDVASRIEYQLVLIEALKASGHDGLAEEAEFFLVKLTELQSECTARLENVMAAKPRLAEAR
ncbi:MAG: hypothetical protein ACT4OF_01155 [Caulobacteraceae bacterium]